MRDGFVGVDLNGGTDRCLRMEWPTRIHLGETRIEEGILINPTNDADPFLVGDAAKISPIARGWSRPLWAAKAGARHNVADLLYRLRNDNVRNWVFDAEMLAAHIRHLVGASSQVGLVVPDDFTPGAQTRFLDVARRASRFDPKRGWLSWLPRPVWRSVAAVFSWASRMDAEEIQRLRGRRVTVVSMLDDRLTVATLEIDYQRVGARTLVTPVRHTMGKSGPNNYPPKLAETELVKEIDDKQVREQVEAVAGARSLARLGSLPFVFQRYDGTWFENARWPGVSENLKDKLRERAQADIRFLKSEIKHGDIVLIECPDTDRGFRNISWSSRYAKKIFRFEGIVEQEVFKLFPKDAAMGACEYVARIFEKLPTYFDHIYEIEIAALDFDGEGHDFIALFPEETRVPGNEEFKRSLEGRFAVQPGSQSLSFHLWRQDDPEHVRTSKTDLDTSPNDLVPITLEVTQRPVSGYATIEVLSNVDGALGGRRIVLDWEKMGVDAKSRDQVIAELDQNLPKSFPNHLPTITHSLAWEINDPRTAMQSYLSTPVTSSRFSSAASDLLVALRRRVNKPKYYNVNIDQPVYLFNSNGGIPEDRNVDPGGLVTKVRAKITEDVKALGGERAWNRPGMPKNMSDLLLAGCWMYAGAPEACVAYLRGVFSGRAVIGRRGESIGRVVSFDDDISSALKWLMARLRQKTSARRPQIARELKTISMIIQYRENSYRFFDSRDAYDLARFALMNLVAQLDGKDARGRPKDLSLSFLFSATAFLLVLRYRKKDPRFFEPPGSGEAPNQFFSEALKNLRNALETLKNDMMRRRRNIHRLAPDVISNAIEFLQKTGGNPDIIVAIAQAEAEAEVDDDESEDED